MSNDKQTTEKNDMPVTSEYCEAPQPMPTADCGNCLNMVFYKFH